LEANQEELKLLVQHSFEEEKLPIFKHGKSAQSDKISFRKELHKHFPFFHFQKMSNVKLF